MLFFRVGLLFLVFWASIIPTLAQGVDFKSARGLALGNTTTVISDAWSIINNPAGLAQSGPSMQLLAGYQNRYVNMGIHDGTIGIAIPIRTFTPALSVSFFGDELLNENRISLAAGHLVGIAQLGLRINYHQVQILGYGGSQAISVDMGGIFALSRQVFLGMLITNLNQGKFNSEQINRLPVGIAVGLSYRPNENLSVNAQVDKKINNAVDYQFGLEYDINATVTFRTGLSIHQPTAHLGFGFNLKAIQLDLAGQYQSLLGFSGAFSIGFKLQKDQ